MSELSEEEQERAKRFLNSIPEDTLNLIVLDRKYDVEWFEEQIDALKEIHDFYADLGNVMNTMDRNDITTESGKMCNRIKELIDTFEQAAKDKKEQGDYRL